jgi:hypothetical protein
MKSKSQSSIEFIILIAFVLFFFVVFFIFIQARMSDDIRSKQDKAVEEVALTVQDEINLASGASEGYSRVFSIPDKIGNVDYSVSLVGNSVYVQTQDNRSAILLPVASITGNIIKGANEIRKVNESIYLNL